MKDWTPEEYDSILARARTGTEDASGLYGYAHLMRPTELEPALRLANCFSIQGRHHAAVKLAVFTLSYLDGELGEKTFLKDVFIQLSTSCKIVGNYELALVFAKASGNEFIVIGAELDARPIPYHGNFPDCAVKEALVGLGCRFYEGSTLSVSTKLEADTMFFWVRDLEQISDLTPAKLGCIHLTRAVICSSTYLRNAFIERLPYYPQDDVHVVLEAPFGSSFKPVAPKERNKIVFIGSEDDYGYLQQTIEGLDVAGRLGVEDSLIDWSEALLYVFCGPTANRQDVERLLFAQANGVMCLSSAVGSLSEYMVAGRLFKPPYCTAHVGAILSSAAKLIRNRDQVEMESKAGGEVLKIFSADVAARRWLSVLRDYA